MNVQQQIRSSYFFCLKHTLNQLTRRIARTSFGPFAIVRHVGRRSGKPYETPIIVSRVKDSFVIELTYGPNVDWHKNVLAANGCAVVWHGKEFAVGKPEPLDTETGRAAFPPLQRLLLRVLGRKHFEKLKIQRPA